MSSFVPLVFDILGEMGAWLKTMSPAHLPPVCLNWLQWSPLLFMFQTMEWAQTMEEEIDSDEKQYKTT